MHLMKSIRQTVTEKFGAAIATSALTMSFVSCVDPGMMAPPVGGQNNPWIPPQRERPVPDRVRPPLPRPIPGPVANATYTNQQAFRKFTLQGYTYIDAKVLADFWRESSPYEAKVRLGRKMLNFGLREGSIHTGQARRSILNRPSSRWPVRYTDGGYSYADMEILGRYWGRGALGAKVKVARHLIEGRDQRNKAALTAARRAGI